MDVNIELVKQIISSDELCDKVNSGDNSATYIKQIENYILYLIDSDVYSNIEFINRYLIKFAFKTNLEDIYFNNIFMKVYSMNIKNDQFLNILDSIKFEENKEKIKKQFDQYVKTRVRVSPDMLVRMLNFYRYIYPKFVFSKEYVDYFTYYLYSLDVSLEHDAICYYYKEFIYYFCDVKGINRSFEIINSSIQNDPYYDNVRRRIIIYSKDISDKVDPLILADIFYQIAYLYILKGINDPNNKVYTFEQLKLVKEICLMSIIGFDYYDENYGSISFSHELKRESYKTASDYFSKLGLKYHFNFNDKTDNIVSNDNLEDRPFSIDILFDQMLKKENPNLIVGLVRNYPVLGTEYKNGKKKSILSLILDIYNSKKLFSNLNKDLLWYKRKEQDLVVSDKIERLNDKISVCSSYINVMNSIILNSDLTSYDLLRSISDLITYQKNDIKIRGDIYLILKDVIPKKIKRLCENRDSIYRENLKRKIIKCYLDSMNLIKNSVDISYFMKLYSTLELCIFSLDID